VTTRLRAVDDPWATFSFDAMCPWTSRTSDRLSRALVLDLTLIVGAIVAALVLSAATLRRRTGRAATDDFGLASPNHG